MPGRQKSAFIKMSLIFPAFFGGIEHPIQLLGRLGWVEKIFDGPFMVCYKKKNGGMSEWLKEAVLKTVVPKGTVGSNPTPSARKFELAKFHQWLVAISF